jgi:hypothetical protein
MTKAAAFRATYADWKLIKTRSVVQVVLEVPLEQADAAYQVLGGMPDPGAERWCAIARLGGNEPVETAGPGQSAAAPQDRPLKPRKPVAAEKRLAQQAGIMCADPVFWAFLEDFQVGRAPVHDEQTAADAIRHYCNVKSRSEISPNSDAGRIWIDLESRFTAWKLAA